MANSIESEQLTRIESGLLKLAQENGYTTGRVSYRNKARLLAWRQKRGESLDSIVERMLGVVERLELERHENVKAKEGIYPQKLYMIRRWVWLKLIERTAEAEEPQP